MERDKKKEVKKDTASKFGMEKSNDKKNQVLTAVGVLN